MDELELLGSIAAVLVHIRVLLAWLVGCVMIGLFVQWFPFRKV